MKKLFIGILSLVLLLNFTSIQKSIGQVETPHDMIIPYGNYTAYCVWGFKNILSSAYSLSACDLCPDKNKNDNVVTFEKFDLTFEKDILKLIINNETTNVNYKQDKSGFSIKFTFNKKNYKFRLYYIENSSGKFLKFLMKEKNGSMLLIEKNG